LVSTAKYPQKRPQVNSPARSEHPQATDGFNAPAANLQDARG